MYARMVAFWAAAILVVVMMNDTNRPTANDLPQEQDQMAIAAPSANGGLQQTADEIVGATVTVERSLAQAMLTVPQGTTTREGATALAPVDC